MARGARVLVALDTELYFFRDLEGREVDFVQMERGRPVRFVECKFAEQAISPALLYLVRKFPGVKAVQVIMTPGVDRVAREGVRLVSADEFLAGLAA
jgi:hypothetical protein